MNEAEYGNLEKKYDLLLMGEILDDKNEVIDIELSSIEIKPACVADDIGQVQFNKNVSYISTLYMVVKIETQTTWKIVLVVRVAAVVIRTTASVTTKIASI